MNPVTGTGCTSVDIGVNANLELVDKFCYLGDMLSVDGDADVAATWRVLKFFSNIVMTIIIIIIVIIIVIIISCVAGNCGEVRHS